MTGPTRLTPRAHPTLTAALTALLAGSTAAAHPHVFIDGGVDFILGPGQVLEALEVTWRYDEFETLYTLASFGVSLDAAGELADQDRQRVIFEHSNWPDDFDGSAHLSIDGIAVPTQWPSDLDARMVDGRLEVSFLRRLSDPTPVTRRDVEVGFYESTYFFAFSASDTPLTHGPASSCATRAIPFRFDPDDTELVAALERLALDETPEVQGFGALVADRIELRCD